MGIESERKNQQDEPHEAWFQDKSTGRLQGNLVALRQLIESGELQGEKYVKMQNELEAELERRKNTQEK